MPALLRNATPIVIPTPGAFTSQCSENRCASYTRAHVKFFPLLITNATTKAVSHRHRLRLTNAPINLLQVVMLLKLQIVKDYRLRQAALPALIASGSTICHPKFCLAVVNATLLQIGYRSPPETRNNLVFRGANQQMAVRCFQ